MSRNSKGFVPILVVLIILGILIAVPFVGGKLFPITLGPIIVGTVKPQPTILEPSRVSTPTVSPEMLKLWKTYTNPKYGYSIRYPSDFAVSKTSTPEKFLIENSNYRLSVESNLNLSDFEEWINDIKSGIKEGGSTEKLEFVGSKEAYLQSGISGEGIFFRNIFVVLDKSITWIRLSADTQIEGNEEPEIYDRVEQFADQILSTFKLTN